MKNDNKHFQVLKTIINKFSTKNYINWFKILFQKWKISLTNRNKFLLTCQRYRLQDPKLDHLNLSTTKHLEKTNIILANVFMKYKKTDKQFVLNDLSFKIEKGQFHAFLGSNGAGKSTTIRLLTGLNQDYTGTIMVNGVNMRDDVQVRKNLTYIPDQMHFPKKLGLYDYLFSTLKLVRLDTGKLKEELDVLIQKNDLTKFKKKNPNRLSSGQKQKVGLIRAILEQGKILVLDEPFSNLDPKSRYFWMSQLKQHNQQYNATIFISSHIINELTEFCDSATIIEHGKILFNGALNENQLQDLYNRLVIKNCEMGT